MFLLKSTPAYCLMLLTIFVYANAIAQTPQPVISYSATAFGKDTLKTKLKGPARMVAIDGRKGINLTSIHGALQLKAHSMKSPKGTVAMWVMSLEDLSTAIEKPTMKISNPHSKIYPLLSDNPNPQDFNAANFKLVWYNGWHPNLIALFGKEQLYENAFFMPHRALISVSHFNFLKRKWYQVALSWDYEKSLYNLYINGILVGSQDQYKAHQTRRDSINSSLYLGNPTLCYSDIRFYDVVLDKNQVYNTFKKEATRFDADLEKELLHTYAGKDRKKFNFTVGADWKQKLNLSLTKSTDLDSFYVQGNPVKVAVEKDGLLIETIDKEMTRTYLDSQVYIWTRKPFEGDLYVEYEFKTMRRGGLSLLLTQASGMNREDFMADYPLRTSGRMTMIYGEDVRSYHWEYYREHADMTNLLNNSALMKQPYNYGLSFGTGDSQVSMDTWHKLQFLQIDNKLVGAIDGVVMVEFEDDGFTNNGAVLDFGRIAIRCMLRSKMLFRNLKVYNKEKIQVTEFLQGEAIRKN